MANGLIKRGRVYSYDFQFLGRRHQGTTHHTNKEEAAKWLRAFRTNLANTGVGLVEKPAAPILSVFLEGAFMDACKQQHAHKPGTLKFYRDRVKVLSSYPPFRQLTIDKVGELQTQAYKESRLAAKMAVSSINAELRCLRKCLIFAQTCGFGTYQKVRSLPGEKSREFVLTGELENLYLSLAPYPLKQAAVLMLDLGLRPGEVVALRKADVSTQSVNVRSGKTANATRSLPQTDRTRAVFELCFALHPDSEWVFPGLRGHYTCSALEQSHRRIREDNSLPEALVPHSLRHSFGTRLAESGAREWEIKSLMGHSSVRVSEKYVHVSSEHTGLAMKRLEEYGRVLRGELEPVKV